MFTSMSCGAGLDLLAGDLDAPRSKPVLEDQLRELPRPGDVRPLADVDEDVAGLRDREGLEAGQPRLRLDLGELARRQSRDRIGDRPDVGRRRPAAAAGDVHEPVAGEPAEDVGHRLRRVVVATELVRQAGVRVDRDGKRRDAREIRDVRPERGGAERAVEPDDASAARGAIDVQNASTVWPLSVRPDASTIVPLTISGRSRAGRRLGSLDAEDRGLAVERVEDRLDEQDVGAASIRPSAASW